VIPADVEAFGHRVADRLRAALGNDLVGVYFVGSIALGGYVSSESDVDVVAVSDHPVLDEMKDAIASDLLDETTACPARGLEFTLYRRQVASSPPYRADFEVNVNGGARMERLVHWVSEREPAFWYVLDRAIAHRYGIVITGPPAAEVFADAPRRLLLDMLGQSMRWHRQHEKATLYSVLNAARAWRFAAEDVLGSKLDGARWARPRWRNPSVIDAAVDLRHGRPATLSADEVDDFLDHVEHAVAAAT
jgi:hypothetical protein